MDKNKGLQFLLQLVSAFTIAAIIFSGLGYYSLFFVLFPIVLVGIEYWTSARKKVSPYLLFGKLLGLVLAFAMSCVLLHLSMVGALSIAGASLLAGLSLLLFQSINIFIGLWVFIGKIVLPESPPREQPKTRLWMRVFVFMAISYTLMGNKESPYAKPNHRLRTSRHFFLNTALKMTMLALVTSSAIVISLYYAAPFVVSAALTAVAAYAALGAIVCALQAVMERGSSRRRAGILGGVLFVISVIAAIIMVVGAFMGDSMVATLGVASSPLLVTPIAALAVAIATIFTVALIGLGLLRCMKKAGYEVESPAMPAGDIVEVPRMPTKREPAFGSVGVVGIQKNNFTPPCGTNEIEINLSGLIIGDLEGVNSGSRLGK